MSKPEFIITMDNLPCVEDWEKNWPNFAPHEFMCNCGGKYEGCQKLVINPDLLVLLEKIRKECGNIPVHLNCGYRCPLHNAEVGGVEDSQHTLGNAADIKIKTLAPSRVARIADSILGNSGGIGLYRTFTHVDVRGNKARW